MRRMAATNTSHFTLKLELELSVPEGDRPLLYVKLIKPKPPIQQIPNSIVLLLF